MTQTGAEWSSLLSDPLCQCDGISLFTAAWRGRTSTGLVSVILEEGWPGLAIPENRSALEEKALCGC